MCTLGKLKLLVRIGEDKVTGYHPVGVKQDFADLKSCSKALNSRLISVVVLFEILCSTVGAGEIKVKVTGLFITKVCHVTRNTFDSIFISAFLGLTLTAIYNNYYYIMHAVLAVFAIVSPSILSGVGNSIITDSQEKNYLDMKKFNFIYMWLAGCCTVCLLCLYQPFTKIAFGKDMMFPFPVVILFCVYFYVLKMGDIRAIYSDACGLWWENRWRNILEALANLVLNFIFGNLWGVYGIISATLISLFFIIKLMNNSLRKNAVWKIQTASTLDIIQQPEDDR